MELQKSRALALVRDNTSWRVVVVGSHQKRFNTIESAADYIESMGVDDQSIDNALIEMLAYRHSRAVFTDGTFAHTEES